MTKYLVFYDEAEHSDRPPPTGLEAMACAIAEASIAKRRHKKYFTAYEESSKEISLEMLRSKLVFTLELSHAGVKFWRDEAAPILKKIDRLNMAIYQSSKEIELAKDDLKSACEETQEFAGIYEVVGSVDQAFNQIEIRNDLNFSEYISKRYRVKSQPQESN